MSKETKLKELINELGFVKATKVLSQMGFKTKRRPVMLKEHEIKRIQDTLATSKQCVVTHSGTRAMVSTYEGYNKRLIAGRIGSAARWGKKTVRA